MKHLIILQLFIFSFFPAFSQYEVSDLKSSQFKANLILLGASASYETRISKKTTLDFEASLNYGFMFSSSDALGNNFGYTLAPGLSVESRRYYNLAKRIRKGKSVANNSGNFVSFLLGYRFAPIAYDNLWGNPTVSITPSWGMQRQIGRRISFEALFGISAIYDTRMKEWEGSPAINVKFGYVIF